MPKLILGKDTEGFVLPNYSGLLGGVAKSQSFSAGVSGGVVFSDGTNLQTDSANFFWDETNNRLGILSPAPTTTLSVSGAVTIGREAATTGQPLFLAWNASGGEALNLRYTETGVTAIPADVWQFRAGGTGRDVVFSTFDTAAVLTIKTAAGAGIEISGGVDFKKGTAPTITGSGALFVSGGATSATELWFREYVGTQSRIYP